jgi:hypothetical protein
VVSVPAGLSGTIEFVDGLVDGVSLGGSVVIGSIEIAPSIVVVVNLGTIVVDTATG